MRWAPLLAALLLAGPVVAEESDNESGQDGTKGGPDEDTQRRRRRALPEHAGGERPVTVSFDGYFRTRGVLLHNLDLDRGPTPSTGETIFPVPASDGQLLGSVDARVRLDLGVEVGDVVRAKLRVDALDGLVLGSTPQGLPPVRWSQTAWGSARQQPPQAGLNAFVDSIRVKEAYAEVLTPIGILQFGRMELPTWGLGIVTGVDSGVDDDYDDAVDRLAFATSLADHLIGVSFDINAVGPTSSNSQGGITTGQAIDLDLADNAYTLSVAVGRIHEDAVIRRRRAAGKATFSYGAYATWRFQRTDLPTFYLGGIASEDAAWTRDGAVERRMNAVLGDLWLRLHAGPLRLELEVAYLGFRVGDPSADPSISLPALTGSQAAGVFEAEVEAVRDRLWAEVGVGFATGDPAPGIGVAPPVGQISSQAGDLDGPQFSFPGDTRIDNFRVHPGYRVDLIFWRSIVGAVSDAVWVRPEVRWRASDAFRLSLAGLVSAALAADSTPSGEPLYGVEVDLAADWRPVAGFQVRGEYGVFFPGSGLDLPGSYRAQPAQQLRLIGAVVW